MSDDSYAVSVDHSQDIEIRKTKDGRMFAIKNIRQEFEDDTMILKADIAGDLQAGNEYLEDLGKCIIKSVIK
jgi:hypothetical protein